MTASLRPPRALLLDFGGVLVETSKRDGWQAVLAKEVHATLARTGSRELDAAAIETDIRAGAAADKCWKDAMSRPFAPREMRDVLCGHVLMVAKGTHDVPYEVRCRPDAVVDDGHGLLDLLTATIEGEE
ncbi:hypothetical protein ACIBI3_44920 [Actinomadura luteofluorescens]|uniref:hypothetical protein n=1 Tax=Actinomadura luteofluorescens TaxID=46163 RepID=UPI00346FAC72